MDRTTAQSVTKSLDLRLFLAPRGLALQRSEDGFVFRPAPMWFNAAMQPALDALNKSECHVLLGPPGSGKSWLLDQLRAKVEAAGTDVLTVKLGQITSDSDLRRQLFESGLYRQWIEGNDRLCILLDSVDEGVMEVRNIVGALKSGFSGAPAERLHLVISCRTAVWPETLTSFLQNLWRTPTARALAGETSEESTGTGLAVHVWEIAPLCEEEIRDAASAFAVDPDNFVQQVVSRRVQSLAEVPLTLFMLLRVHGSDGGLPQRAVDLYERGIAKLCEPALERTDRQHAGKLTPQQRLEVLSAIAAMTLLTGHTGLHVGGDDGGPSAGVSRDLLLGLECGKDGSTIVIDTDVLYDIRAHGPLEAQGPDLQALSSKSHADFLAARFLNRAEFSPAEVFRLVSVQERDGSRVAPQLHEVVAWLASMDERVRNAVLASEPEILLQSDVAVPGEDFIERLVVALFGRVRAGALSCSDRRSFDALLPRLKHPRLVEQVIAVLRNSGEVDAVIEFAISIAERCDLTEAADAIFDVVLDASRSAHIRKVAGYAVVGLGEENSCCAMTVLLQPGTDDPDDDLRGLALRATWPRHLGAAELFDALTPPKRSNHGGAYSGFLTRDLAREIDEADLLPAVEWAARVPVRDPDCWSGMERIAGKLLAKAFTSAPRPEIDRVLARAAMVRARKHAAAFYIEKANEDHGGRGNDVAAVQEMIDSDETRRRAVVEHLLQDAHEDHDLSRIVYGPTRWVLEQDFPWVLARVIQHEQAGDTSGAKRWACVANLLFLRACQSSIANLDLWLRYREHSAIIREVMPYRLLQRIGEPNQLPRITDPEARQEKCRYLRERRFMEHRHQSQPPLVPAGWLESWITACETKSSQTLENLFYNMSFERQRERVDPFRPRDVTPGWERLSEADRERVLEAAVRYLNENSHRAEEFVTRRYGDGSGYVYDYAAIQAVHLLLRHRPHALDALSDEVWSTWTRMLLPMLTTSFHCEAEEQEQLLRINVRRAKAAADSTLVREVEARRENEQFGANLLHHYQHYGLIDPPLAQLLMISMANHRYVPERLAEVIGAVCAAVPSQAVKPVSQIISSPVADDVDRKRIAYCAAAAVIAVPQTFWPIVWPRASQDLSVAKQVLSRIAHNVAFARQGNPLSGLSASGAGEMLHWLFEHFGPESDPDRDGEASDGVTDDDSLRHMRNRLLNRLIDDGSGDAVAYLRQLRDRYPHHSWLHDCVLDAEKAWRQNQWQAVSPHELRRLYVRARRVTDPNVREDAHRFHSLLVANGTLTNEAPTLVTITPAPKRWRHFRLFRRWYVLTLWCQHPGGPHPCVEEPDVATYEFSRPRAWFVRVAPVLRLCIQAGRVAMAIGGMSSKIDAESNSASLQSKLDAMDTLVTTFAPVDERSTPKSVDADAPLEGAPLRALHELLKELDPMRQWGGLRSVPQASGAYIWVCPAHYQQGTI